ncbi:MAG: restriction endonuclease [Firmicutes bacterium ML8_F2]|nr:MAG: restriction endonuclease [Firmicutes bacterium ML8_F2]
MQAEELNRIIEGLRIWQRGDERAPHKPLLILFALGRLVRGDPRLMSYAGVKDDLRKLLIEFGPYRQTYSPGYPFVRLANDKIWEISGSKDIDTKKDWSDRELIDNNTLGGFTEEVYSLLCDDRNLVRQIAEYILNSNFPDTIHQDILSQVGLELEPRGRLVRSPDFRNKVLSAYEYKCAVCGFNVRLGDTLVAVEAAHIKWHQAGGPDEISNGIALCSMHHKLFDRGVFTLNDDMVFRVAEDAHMEEWLMRYNGKQIRKPQRPDYYPEDDFLYWHVREVFRGPARYYN